jgi:choline dehydrogenase-like flavoprotein
LQEEKNTMTLSQKEFDAIIVGSGPGGATVARELSLKGQEVLVLEWGDNDPVKGTLRQVIPRAFLPGKGLLITGQMLGMIRGITTGGSSLYYCGTAFDPPVDMLKTYGVDISDEAAALKNEVPMTPLSDELVSPAGKIFMKSALELGYDCRKLDKFIYQDKCRTRCQLCSYGCPHGAKWNARNFVDEALENGAKMVNRAKVDKVIVENKKAIGVEYKHKGERKKVFASRIIVAGGGIGSPVILRKSGIHGVGYDFFFDPLRYVLGKVDNMNEGKGIPMSTGIHFKEDGIVMTDFNMPHMMKIIFDLEAFKLKQALSYKNVLPIMIKVRDRLGGRIVNGKFIWKTLSKDDKQKLDTGVAHARRILENAGASNIYRSWVLAAHPGGTVKIGETINSDLQTQIDNLYVCDCSVLPEAWGLPPTFTLLALGKRLGKHIMNSHNG